MNRSKKLYIQNLMIKYIFFLIGMGILSFGLFNIHNRYNITEGGVLGLTLLIENFLNISPSISSFIINTICFMIGFYILGKGFIIDSIIASSLFSMWYKIFENIGYKFFDISNYPILISILGAFFIGTGTGLIVIFNGAASGDDAMAIIINKKFNMPISLVYFISDISVLLLSLSYISINNIFYSIISVIISSLIVEVICRISCNFLHCFFV